jgi:hypothetical protein
MKFWYFKFEGEFTKGSPEYGYHGVISSCFIPESNYQKARAIFMRALEGNEIKLVEILEHFSVDGEELDPKDKDNKFWIKWYKEAKKKKAPVFDKWHVFNE